MKKTSRIANDLLEEKYPTKDDVDDRWNFKTRDQRINEIFEERDQRINENGTSTEDFEL